MLRQGGLGRGGGGWRSSRLYFPLSHVVVRIEGEREGKNRSGLTRGSTNAQRRKWLSPNSLVPAGLRPLAPKLARKKEPLENSRQSKNDRRKNEEKERRNELIISTRVRDTVDSRVTLPFLSTPTLRTGSETTKNEEEGARRRPRVKRRKTNNEVDNVAVEKDEEGGRVVGEKKKKKVAEEHMVDCGKDMAWVRGGVSRREDEEERAELGCRRQEWRTSVHYYWQNDQDTVIG